MKPLASNKKAYFDYEILETYEAGLELKGYEVKSIKSGHINLAGAYVVIKDNQAWLVNADVAPYQPANIPADYDSKRSRRLLLRTKEIQALIGKIHEKGLTLVPLKVYNKRGLVKIEIGLGRGKKKADKRETIKKRETEREIRRTLKS